jgi:hypothetical protein
MGERLIQRRILFAFKLDLGEPLRGDTNAHFEPVFYRRFQRKSATKLAVDIDIAPTFILDLRRNLGNLVQNATSFCSLFYIFYHESAKKSTGRCARSRKNQKLLENLTDNFYKSVYNG